jgi:hypothetical protein
MTTQRKLTNKKFDIFSWNHPLPVVDPADRPSNVLDKKPDDHEARSVESLVNDFLTNPISNIAFRNLDKQGIIPSYGDIAKEQHIPLKELHEHTTHKRRYH